MRFNPGTQESLVLGSPQSDAVQWTGSNPIWVISKSSHGCIRWSLRGSIRTRVNPEVGSRVWSTYKNRDTLTTRWLSKDGHWARVPSKVSNVVLHPAQCSHLVQVTPVPSAVFIPCAATEEGGEKAEMSWQHSQDHRLAWASQWPSRPGWAVHCKENHVYLSPITIFYREGSTFIFPELMPWISTILNISHGLRAKAHLGKKRAVYHCSAHTVTGNKQMKRNYTLG